RLGGFRDVSFEACEAGGSLRRGPEEDDVDSALALAARELADGAVHEALCDGMTVSQRRNGEVSRLTGGISDRSARGGRRGGEHDCCAAHGSVGAETKHASRLQPRTGDERSPGTFCAHSGRGCWVCSSAMVEL